MGHLLTWEVPLSVSYHFAFSYCSWGSQGKNTEVVCNSLLQWTTLCQTSPPWPAHLGWAHTAWLSFTELDKAVVCAIRLASFLWLWFQCVFPLMPSRNTYHLTWVSLIVLFYSRHSVKMKVTESCPALCNPVDYTVHEILHVRTGVGRLSLLQGIFPPRDQTQISCMAGRFFTSWATKEV